MSGIALIKLSEEYKTWNIDNPYRFVAKPAKTLNGSLNLLIWECYIPGKINTSWENGMYFLRMIFDENYPLSPPECIFDPPLFHPNVNSSGNLFLNEGWSSDITIKQILLDIQHLLDEPNMNNAEPGEAYKMFCENRIVYETLVRAYAEVSKGEYLSSISRN